MHAKMNKDSIQYNSFVSLNEFNSLKAAYEDTIMLLADALKRITQLETALFAKNEDGDIITKDDVPVLSPNFTQSFQIESNNEEQESFVPDKKLEKAAVELIKFACSRPVMDGVRAITPKLLHQFRQGILPEELRPNTVNPRQWKKELFELLCHLSPDIKTDKKGNNRGVRLLIPRNFNPCKLRVS